MKQNFTVLLVILLAINLVVGSNNINDIKASNLSSETIKLKANEEVPLINNQDLSTLGIYPKDQVMGWLIIDFLGSYMQKSLSGYYGGNVPYWVTTPTSQVLDAKYVDDCACYIIKLQVVPYLGAHNPIGLDNFTFKISLPDNNKITLEKYEHVKSFKVPDHVKKQHLDLNLQ